MWRGNDIDRTHALICKTSDLIWRNQKLVSTISAIDSLFSTPLRHSDMDLSFPIPVIGKVVISTRNRQSALDFRYPKPAIQEDQ